MNIFGKKGPDDSFENIEEKNLYKRDLSEFQKILIFITF